MNARNLDQLRKQAKELLKAYCDDHEAAVLEIERFERSRGSRIRSGPAASALPLTPAYTNGGVPEL